MSEKFLNSTTGGKEDGGDIPKPSDFFISPEDTQILDGIMAKIEVASTVAEQIDLVDKYQKLLAEAKHELIVHEGDLYIEEIADYIDNSIRRVNGSIKAPISVKFEMNNLENVAGNLFLKNATEFSSQKLETVDLSIYVSKATEFNTPNLISVGANIYVIKATEFNAPNLLSVDDTIFANNATKFNAPNLKAVKKIYLSRSKIKDEDIHIPAEMWEKIEWV